MQIVFFSMRGMVILTKRSSQKSAYYDNKVYVIYPLQNVKNTLQYVRHTLQ